MRVECAWCGKDLGEKCPACGSDRIIFCEADREHAHCLECDGIFAVGAGGVSSTICEDCRQTPNLRGRLTEGEIVERAAARGSR